jgi:hypothetical protein
VFVQDAGLAAHLCGLLAEQIQHPHLRVHRALPALHAGRRHGPHHRHRAEHGPAQDREPHCRGRGQVPRALRAARHRPLRQVQGPARGHGQGRSAGDKLS